MCHFVFFQVSAMLSSPELESTGSKGHCVSFSYAMDGLSVDKLRVLLQPVTNDGKDKSETSEVESVQDYNIISHNQIETHSNLVLVMF